MSLLSSLLEFSNFQPTSLALCQSPKEINLDRNTKGIKDVTSAKKQEILTPQKRTASKSLTKLDLMSFNTVKIDPRERLLHRMVHKLSMKCRKYYYTFFVVLENLKKKNIQLYQPIKTNKQDNRKIQTAFGKIVQLEQILFSKYFSNHLKKSSFQGIVKWSKHKTALNIMIQILNKRSVHYSFKNLENWSHKIQRQQIRMDILIDSISQIERSTKKINRLENIRKFMSCLKEHNVSTCVKNNERQTFKTPPKGKSEKEVINTQSFTVTHRPFSKEKTNNLFNSFQHNYQNMKTRKKTSEESTGKARDPIEVSCQQVKLKFQKCYNYIKDSKCKTNLKEQTIPFKSSKQPQFQISKRCEPISINVHEIPDLNDKGSIFFNQLFTSIPSRNNSDIAESSVRLFCKKDSINQSFSEESRTASQVSLITPLIQKNYQSPKKNLVSNGLRGSCFGSQAVNFKNSLVIERETMKDHQGVREKKQFNFAKIKNQVKNQKRAHDEYFQADSRYKIENRPESTQKEYNSIKLRRQSDFSISIPLTANQSANTTGRQGPYIKRSSDTPQPDIRGYYNSQRKHLSLLNSNKVQLSQQDARRSVGATYLKIISKK